MATHNMLRCSVIVKQHNPPGEGSPPKHADSIGRCGKGIGRPDKTRDIAYELLMGASFANVTRGFSSPGRYGWKNTVIVECSAPRRSEAAIGLFISDRKRGLKAGGPQRRDQAGNQSNHG
jgi:hypothetical protein